MATDKKHTTGKSAEAKTTKSAPVSAVTKSSTKAPTISAKSTQAPMEKNKNKDSVKNKFDLNTESISKDSAKVAGTTASSTKSSDKEASTTEKDKSVIIAEMKNMSKTDLLKYARKANIEGRSKMDKEALLEALAK